MRQKFVTPWLAERYPGSTEWETDYDADVRYITLCKRGVEKLFEMPAGMNRIRIHVAMCVPPSFIPISTAKIPEEHYNARLIRHRDADGSHQYTDVFVGDGDGWWANIDDGDLAEWLEDMLEGRDVLLRPEMYVKFWLEVE